MRADAASGSGKTFVVIDLIGAMVSGEQFANRFSMMRPLNVGYCAGEGVSGLPARFKAMINKRNLGWRKQERDPHASVPFPITWRRST